MGTFNVKVKIDEDEIKEITVSENNKIKDLKQKIGKIQFKIDQKYFNDKIFKTRRIFNIFFL